MTDKGPSEDNKLYKNYKVLARKYRPTNFTELIGQDTMVQTLINSFNSGRIPQAYMLNGIRGIGKTTTARILARALNYSLEKNKETPTVDIKKIGLNCEAIMESRHPDVFEMDAASNTGIDNIREIIGLAQTKPSLAKYKIFIIDEVHMLSRQAFNGLLKILEEPPEHVKFIFATTEIRKIPITVISRCQRFNLQRIAQGALEEYLEKIIKIENVISDKLSLSVIAKASDGSVRDALSLLDQAIVLCESNITYEKIYNMLNYSDQGVVIDLFKIIILGKIDEALEKIKQSYKNGLEPLTILTDLAEIAHTFTLIKINKENNTSFNLTNEQFMDASQFIDAIDMSSLVHMWQMLLKGYKEIEYSFNAFMSLEMLLVKLCYSSQLPSISDIISKLESKIITERKTIDHSPREDDINIDKIIRPKTYEEAISIVGDYDIRLIGLIDDYIKLVKYKIGYIEIELLNGYPDDIINNFKSTLEKATSLNWDINVTDSHNKPINKDALTVENFKNYFPDAEIINKD